MKALKQTKYDSIAIEETGADDLDKFRAEVLSGLASNPKRLSSKYFYDRKGDELFKRIMKCSEYYLTRCELEIFQSQKAELASLIANVGALPFDLIELGVGDGTKTHLLLRELLQTEINFNYLPIDISGNILSELEKNFSDLDGLKINALQGEYLNMLKEASRISNNRKVVLFLGSNIGNMHMNEARQFCENVRGVLQPGDLFLIGFDLKKNPQTILNAYNDTLGYTREFNLNLLQRINSELDADFEINDFKHYPTYDPHTGACKSYLVSIRKQSVRLGDIVIPFDEGEWIFTEISQKYSLDGIKQIAVNSGFSVLKNLTDKKHWFIDSIWSASASGNIATSIL
jgi:dimethylhistidine N-methyltransferase